MKSLVNIIAFLITAASWLLAIAMSFYGLFYSFDIIASVFGTTVAFISLIFLPILWGITPLYALFAFGDWSLLLVTYGAIPVAMFGVMISGFLQNLVGED